MIFRIYPGCLVGPEAALARQREAPLRMLQDSTRKTALAGANFARWVQLNKERALHVISCKSQLFLFPRSFTRFEPFLLASLFRSSASSASLFKWPNWYELERCGAGGEGVQRSHPSSRAQLLTG